MYGLPFIIPFIRQALPFYLVSMPCQLLFLRLRRIRSCLFHQAPCQHRYILYALGPLMDGQGLVGYDEGRDDQQGPQDKGGQAVADEEKAVFPIPDGSARSAPPRQYAVHTSHLPKKRKGTYLFSVSL